jgi:hypothetical protein
LSAALFCLCRADGRSCRRWKVPRIPALLPTPPLPPPMLHLAVSAHGTHPRISPTMHVRSPGSRRGRAWIPPARPVSARSRGGGALSATLARPPPASPTATGTPAAPPPSDAPTTPPSSRPRAPLCNPPPSMATLSAPTNCAQVQGRHADSRSRTAARGCDQPAMAEARRLRTE